MLSTAWLKKKFASAKENDIESQKLLDDVEINDNRNNPNKKYLFHKIEDCANTLDKQEKIFNAPLKFKRNNFFILIFLCTVFICASGGEGFFLMMLILMSGRA